jgi:signal peptidase II
VRRPEPPRRSGKALALCLGGVAALTAADLASKHWAVAALASERTGDAPPVCEPDEHDRVLMQRLRRPPIVLTDGYLELRYAENCGAAFGLMRDASVEVRRIVFGTAAILASIVLLWMFWRGRGGMPFAVSVPFIVSGAIGNLHDRVLYGYVVDFIRFHWREEFEYPTFNGADIAITVGVVLLLVDGLREGRREKEREKQAQAAEVAEAKPKKMKKKKRPQRDEEEDAGGGDAPDGDGGDEREAEAG